MNAQEIIELKNKLASAHETMMRLEGERHALETMLMGDPEIAKLVTKNTSIEDALRQRIKNLENEAQEQEETLNRLVDEFNNDYEELLSSL